MKSSVFREVTQCSLVKSTEYEGTASIMRFEETAMQGTNKKQTINNASSSSLAQSSTLKTEKYTPPKLR
jgi:hypothetical protein